MKSRKLQSAVFFTLTGLLIFTMLFAMTQGSVRIPVKSVVGIISDHFFPRENDVYKASYVFIVKHVRLPRILLASMVGGALAIIGVSFQAVFRNPMADPYVMGVSSGAAFGATIGIVFGFGASFLGLNVISTMAFMGALLTVLTVYQLAKVGHKVSTTGILLAGFVANSILTSMISMMMLMYHSEIDKIVTWTMGSFNAASWDQFFTLLVPLGIGIALLVSKCNELNAIVMGDEEAQNIGVDVQKTKKIILITSAFIAAFAVASSGIIGFVGLVVPHMLRFVFGANHKRLIPMAFIGGALFLLICDTFARSIIPNMEVPVGIVTSIIGGPFFLILLQKHKKTMV